MLINTVRLISFLSYHNISYTSFMNFVTVEQTCGNNCFCPFVHDIDQNQIFLCYSLVEKFFYFYDYQNYEIVLNEFVEIATESIILK